MMILIQRIAEKQLIHHGVVSINSSAVALPPSAQRSVARTPPNNDLEKRDSSGKRTRRSSY